MSAYPYARIAVARPLPEPLTYAVPPYLLDQLALGHMVQVPLGSQQEIGYVIERTADCDIPPAKVRSVSKLLDPLPVFDRDQLAFYSWIAGYYLASLGLVIRTATPTELAVRSVRGLLTTDAGIEALTAKTVEERDAIVLREVIARPGLTRRGLATRLRDELEGKQVERAIHALARRGLVDWEEREVSRGRAERKVVVRIGDDTTARAAIPRAGARISAILEAWEQEGGELDLAALAKEQGGSTHQAVRRLIACGAARIETREIRDPLQDARPLGRSTPPDLNADQRQALESLTADDAAGTWLLYGVTGSGKTEVFLGAAQHALDCGKSVVVLVPEIGLTPQLVGRFKARFGDRVAVLHSGLTARDRLAYWRKIRAGEADVVVGARSALFAPFQTLGLIVVDEEHDDSYKQDDGVRYHARDLAVVLGQRHSAPVILASATPSLESWHNAQTGKYRILRLLERATPRPVPTIEIIDRRELPKDENGKRPLLAPVVVRALEQSFARGRQAIVLYNRRGYATMVQCADCGATWECPNCGISMTLHRSAHVLACHYCGLRRPQTETCPTCKSPALLELGTGTERVVEHLETLFPSVSIGRMDADTTAARGAHERILTDFREGRIQLLAGTQIVAKGHDFPNVETAVIVSADSGLHLPDFRAAERTVALVVQAAGRAGRGEVRGQVWVQTSTPESDALLELGDVDAFLERERERRRRLSYPPWTRLVLLSLDGVDRAAVLRASGLLAQDLRKLASSHRGVVVLGPASAAMPRLVGRWRFQVVIRGAHVVPLRTALTSMRERIDATSGQGVRLTIDVDPRHLM